MGFIEIQNVSKTFVSGRTTRPVLDRVCMQVDKGEFVSIVGTMGCGKSTLLGVAAGLIEPDSGRVVIGGETIDGIRPDVSIVFQNYSLLPWFSALENVRLAIGATFPERKAEEQRSVAVRYLEMVGLGQALGKRPGQLSGGMRQRVAIARAFATEPRILFLDDPFGALDAMTRATLQKELVDLCSRVNREVTTIMITNNLEEAILVSDRIVPMTPGPRATLAEPVPVDLPRPRSPEQLMHDKEACRVRTYVTERLTEELGRSRRGSEPRSEGEFAESVLTGGR